MNSDAETTVKRHDGDLNNLTVARSRAGRFKIDRSEKVAVEVSRSGRFGRTWV